MEHRLISAVEGALAWRGSTNLGGKFARGNLGDPDLLQRLLTPNKLLDLVMRRSLSNPQVRVFREGNELHPREYLSAVSTRRGQNISVVNMHRLGSLLEAGATLVLDGGNAFDPTLEVVCRAMQWWAHERVQVNIYATTSDASGFGLHWDDHEVLVVQMAGEKTWEVRGPSRISPMFRDSERNITPSEEIVWEGTMAAGDVMHIPRGYWHCATRVGQEKSGHSIHMTFGFPRRTGASWLGWLAEWCRDDEIFRHNLYRDDSPHEQAQQARELYGAAQKLIAARGPSDYLEHVERETTPARQVPWIEAFGPLEAVVCTTEFAPRIDVNDDCVEITSSGLRISLPSEAEHAVRMLLSGHPVRLVPGNPEMARFHGSIRGLASVFVKEGLCSVLTPELSSGYTDLVTNATP
ncbi:JmjC domain-containing protein [Embleya sp. NPDC050493]|uniref:JmjC domain-containing protein n=1 Tax=Embleya sp. NPDC050493 TaxID=3363989 RepID=UPI00379F0A87